VRVRSELPGVGEHLARFYSDFPARASEGEHFDVAIVRGQRLRRWLRPQSSFVVNGTRPFLPLPATLAGPAFEWGLNWCIGSKSHRWIVAHAAVVERHGRVLMMPAASGSGKSTLCAALACSGWRLFSDEFALIDPETGRLWPAPRPISLKNASIELIAEHYADVVYGPEGIDVDGARFVHLRSSADSVRRSQESAPVGWIVLPQYSANAQTTLERIPKAQALMELAGQSFNYNYLLSGYSALAELVRGADCFRVEYSVLDDVLERLTRLTTP
jgi:HprK-related kinase A